MAEVLQQNTYQRGLNTAREAARRASETSDEEAEPADAAEEQEEASSRSLKSRLNVLRDRAKGKEDEKNTNVLQQEAEKKLQKEIAQRLSWRAVNMAMGATVILVILTILVWTVQFIGGNMMGSKKIPKLGIGETILWLIGVCLLFTIFNMIMLGITLLVQVYENPLSTLANVSGIFWDLFWSIFK